MLAHIVFDTNLMEEVRKETERAFTEHGGIDMNHLTNSCPRLNSIWLETLRLSASSTVLRHVTEDQKLGEYMLRKGRTLLISARQLHYDERAFGADAQEFNPDRFLASPTLHRSPNFRPFGGGKTLCPGRHLARSMVFSFVAILLRRYNVELAKPQEFPKYEECKPAIGIIGGFGDVLLKLQER